jgi:hypothetical protein
VGHTILNEGKKMGMSGITTSYSHLASNYSAYQLNRTVAMAAQQKPAKIGETDHSEFSKSIEKTISNSDTLAGSINATIGMPTTYAEAMKASTAPQHLNYYA